MQELETSKAEGQLKVDMAVLANSITVLTKQIELTEKEQDRLDLVAQAELERDKDTEELQISFEKARQELAILLEAAKAEAVVKRFNAIAPGLSEALTTLSRNDTLVKIAEASSFQHVIGGSNAIDALSKAFEGTGLGDAVKLFLAHGGKALTRAASTEATTGPKQI